LDPSLQAGIGLMSITGERGGTPLRVPVPLVDFMTGQYAVASVLAALWRASRDGAGGVLDCAMADSTAALTGTAAMLAFGGQLEPRRVGAESHLRGPSGVWRAAHGGFGMMWCVTDRRLQAASGGLGP